MVDETRRRHRIVVGAAATPTGPPLTRSLERSVPWDAADRDVCRTDDAAM